MSAWPDGEDGVVDLPDGSRLKGGSWKRLRRTRRNYPDFLVLLLGREPVEVPCPHIWVRWPDFGVPASTDQAVAALQLARERSRNEKVAIMCGSGVGRTGTALALLTVFDGLSAEEGIRWVRENYHPRAVETPWQRRWLKSNVLDNRS